MYGIVSLLGCILRQFFLPNPFTNLITNEGIAFLANLIFGGFIIGTMAYILTGCVYQKGEAPFIGSFLYTISYTIITFTFLGITLLIKNIIIACVVYLVLYIIACILLSNLNSRTIKF